MSKVVTIPKDRNPFVVIVNGVKHSYPAGVTTEVPDEVADVIEKYVGAKPKPDPNAGINFGSAQSDWNQTDSSAADFIKNKPFGDSPAVLLEEQELQYDAEAGGCTGVVSAPINDGDQLTVVYDGESYECTAVIKPDMGFIVFGNLSFIGGDDTGEPFAGMNFDTILIVIAVDLNDTQNHTVKISGTVPKKIDPKYLKTFSKIYLSQGSTADTKYLCSDVMGTTPISQADLAEAAKLPIVLSVGDGIFYYPVGVVPYAGNYGYITIHYGENLVTYYTAEHTG